MNAINREIIEHIESIIKTFRSKKYVPTAFSNVTSDLTISEILLLMMLTKSGSATVGDIAAHGDVKAPTASAMVKKLEKLGYVQKNRDCNDKRKVYVELSARGKKIMKQTRDINLGYLGMFFSMISGRERQNAMELLEKIQGLLKKI